MTKIEKTEIFLEGYLQGIIGSEFTQSKKELIMSHIDNMLHSKNLKEIDMIEEPIVQSGSIKYPRI